MAYTPMKELSGAVMFAVAKHLASKASEITGRTFWASLSRNSSGCSAYIFVAEISATKETDGYDQVFALSNKLRLSDHGANFDFKAGTICGRGMDFDAALSTIVSLA